MSTLLGDIAKWLVIQLEDRLLSLRFVSSVTVILSVKLFK